MSIKSECLVDREVERLFRENPPERGELCTNPVTGGNYVGGDDPIGPQKEVARRALFAREWFALYGPADAQPLPVSYAEREDLKLGGGLLPYIRALFARSLEGRDYNVGEHPPFPDYVSGVLWEAGCADTIIGRLPSYPDLQLEQLKKRFPPRQLKGLGLGFCWEPHDAQHVENMERHRRLVEAGRRMHAELDRESRNGVGN